MSKRIVLISVLLTMAACLAGVSASADNLSTYASALAPFLYEGSSYVPLKSTADFLGAPLRWDADTSQAVMTYNGRDLALSPNSRRAYYAGRAVELSSPMVVIDGVTYVPVDTLKKYYDVPVEWDRTRSEMRIKGPQGWRTMKANSRSPWHGSPPPWAPAWGQRGHGTPGHPANARADRNAKAKGSKAAVTQRWHDTPGHPGNAKANGNGLAKNNKNDR